MKVHDEEEAIRLANDTRYGLGASVFTRDTARGEQVARRIIAGNVWVNDAIMSYLAQEAPFAGARESGLGGRHGAGGIQKYCQPQTILVTRFGPKRDVTMFPNSAAISHVLERLMVLLWGRDKG
jgi:acyl-CoA reductase-like NAD-dependent aldehyde dehydrogenase